MGMPRASIEDLRLRGDKNIKRALKYDAKQPLAKREDLERLYGELKERRADLLREVRREGVVIQVEKSNSRGAIYHATITNPAFTALRATEIQIVNLAKLIGGGDPTPKRTALDEELDEIRRSESSFDEFCSSSEPS